MRTIKPKDKEFVQKLNSQYNLPHEYNTLNDFEAYNSNLRNLKKEAIPKQHTKIHHNPRVSKLISSLEVPRKVRVEGFSVSSEPSKHTKEIIDELEELTDVSKKPTFSENRIRSKYPNLFKQNDFRNARIRDYRYISPLYYEYDLEGMTPEKEIEINMGRDSEMLKGHPILRAKGDKYEEFIGMMEERRKARKATSKPDEKAADEIPENDIENEIETPEYDEDFEIARAKLEGRKLEVKKATDLLKSKTPAPKKGTIEPPQAPPKSQAEIEEELERFHQMKLQEYEQKEKESNKEEEPEPEPGPEEIKELEKQTAKAQERRREIYQAKQELIRLKDERTALENNSELPETGRLVKLNEIDQQIRVQEQIIFTGNTDIVNYYDEYSQAIQERLQNPKIPNNRALPKTFLKKLNIILESLSLPKIERVNFKNEAGETKNRSVTNEDAYNILTGMMKIPIKNKEGKNVLFDVSHQIEKKRPKEFMSESKASKFGTRGVKTISDINEPLSPPSPLNFTNTKASELILGKKDKK